MEILLLIIVIVFLFTIKSSIDSRFTNLDDHLSDLHTQLQALKKDIDKKKIVTFEDIKPLSSVTDSFQKPFVEVKKPIIEVISVVENIEATQKEEFAYDEIPVATFEDSPKPHFPKKEPVFYEPQKSWWDTFKEDNPDLEKFIGENLINKIGILILVLGISYFVKYSIDKGWINEPARVGIGILSGALVMAIAHRLRQQYAAFSSVFVAGAIAIFYFTIGIAFHSYHLFSQTVAFALMVVITAFSCLVSLSYNRKELAVLSLIGGFAVPFMVSTGQGNYVVLFTYITILDLGILAIAYHKDWRIVNILSYIFTVLLFGGWLYKDMNETQPHYLGALGFGFVFYLIFILTNIIHNLRTKSVFSTTDWAILTSNTFLFYGASMLILNQYHPEFKGLFTTGLGALNLIYAWFLHKKFNWDKNTVYLFLGMTLTFVTLAIPIQFSGNYITLFWAAEAVLLMWLGQKSKVAGYRFGSVIVTVLMLASLVMDWQQNYMSGLDFSILFNTICTTGIFSIVCLSAIYYLLKDEKEDFKQFGITFSPEVYRTYIGIAAVLTTYIVGFLEVNFQARNHISGAGSADSVVVLYHLLFSALVFFALYKKKTVPSYILATLLGIANILLWTFWFSNYPFYENTDNLLRGGVSHGLGFYLHYLSLGIVLYLGIGVYKIHKDNDIYEFFKSDAALWLTSFLIVYLASSELMLHGVVFSSDESAARNQIIKAGFPILWGILAFAFLIIGIKRENKTIRIIALALLGLTIAKLFLYDIKNASETGKIIAFILLGVLILIISFVYQKLKVLVLDDGKKKENDKDIEKL
jgi:uncharacterized membrane protein